MSSEDFIPSKTVCVQCKWHNGASPDAVWYNHFCRHPDVQRVSEQDPVTGKVLFAHKNDLGGVHLGDERRPHCRDINKGNCQYFQAKKVPGMMRTASAYLQNREPT